MMKVYGAHICIDCRNWVSLARAREIDHEYVDITESTGNLRDFLRIRDASPLFAAQRSNGGIGIPLFVYDDGRMTLSVDEALAWVGQPPVRDE